MSFVPVFVDFCSKLFLDKACNAFFGNMNLNIIDIYDRKTITYRGDCLVCSMKVKHHKSVKTQCNLHTE